MSTFKRWCLLMALYMSSQLSFGQVDQNWNATPIFFDDFNTTPFTNDHNWSIIPSLTAPDSSYCDFCFNTNNVTTTTIGATTVLQLVAKNDNNCPMSNPNPISTGMVITHST